MVEKDQTSNSEIVKKFAVDPDTQASAVLTFGPLIWRWISNISNVDFLLTINGEKFNTVLNFLEGPGWFLLSMIGFLWLAANWIFKSYKTPKPGPSWSLLGTSVFVAFLFGILLAVDSTGAVPRTIVGWGSTDIHICNATVDMTKLVIFKKNYKLAVVCGFPDATKDRLEDENITVSNAFTIVAGLSPIVASVRPGMAQRAAQLMQEAQAAAGNANVTVAIPTWYETILLPNDVSTSKIAKLSDVMNLGGKILNSQYFN